MKITSSATTVSNSDPVTIGSSFRSFTRAVQVEITGGTGSAKLQGRSATDAPWVDLGSAFAASGVQFLQLTSEVRVAVTAVSGATINVWVDAQKA